MPDPSLARCLWDFICSWGRWFRYHFAIIFHFFENFKSNLASNLYRQRGRYTRPFVHSSMALLVVAGIILGPVLVEENLAHAWQKEFIAPPVLLATSANSQQTATLISLKPRSETVEYIIKTGDTISTIAEKFSVSVDTIRWENNLQSVKSIKVGQKLRIPPVTGILYSVKRGDTIYSIAKKYQVDAQVIVDWPYNTFANDETFALAVGQQLMIPDGIKPKEIPVQPPRYYAQVPAAGIVTGTGRFAWPVGGAITQAYRWYHKGIDIANKGAPDVLAADTGQVIVVGWPTPWAYGNRVVIDHGNGFATLYGHLSQIYVSAGQRVERGQAVGKMGTTGRSTGLHLHFEIRQNGNAVDPMGFLK